MLDRSGNIRILGSAMRRPRLFSAVVLAVALFTAPTAWACGEVLMWLDCCLGVESEPEPAETLVARTADSGKQRLKTVPKKKAAGQRKLKRV